MIEHDEKGGRFALTDVPVILALVAAILLSIYDVAVNRSSDKLVVIILALLAGTSLATVVSRRSYERSLSHRLQELIRELRGTVIPSVRLVESFAEVDTFANRVATATSLHVSGPTLMSFLSQNETIIRQLLERGGRVSLLYGPLTNEGVMQYREYFGPDAKDQHWMAAAQAAITSFKKRVGDRFPKNCTVKELKKLPLHNLVFIEGPSSEAVAQVQLNVYGNDHSSPILIFHEGKQPTVYKMMKEEYNRLFADAS